MHVIRTYYHLQKAQSCKRFNYNLNKNSKGGWDFMDLLEISILFYKKHIMKSCKGHNQHTINASSLSILFFDISSDFKLLHFCKVDWVIKCSLDIFSMKQFHSITSKNNSKMVWKNSQNIHVNLIFFSWLWKFNKRTSNDINYKLCKVVNDLLKRGLDFLCLL